MILVTVLNSSDNSPPPRPFYVNDFVSLPPEASWIVLIQVALG